MVKTKTANEDRLIVNFYQDLDDATKLTVEIKHMPETLRGRMSIMTDGFYTLRSINAPELSEYGLYLWGANEGRDEDTMLLTYKHSSPERLLTAVRAFKQIIKQTNDALAAGKYS